MKNGITTLFSFITQGKQSDLAEDVKAVKDHAASGLFCNLGWHITPVRWDEETFDEIETLIDRGQRSFKFYTTYRMAGLYRSYAQIEVLPSVLVRGTSLFWCIVKMIKPLPAPRDRWIR